MEKKNKVTAAWNVQVPLPLDQALIKALTLDFHLTKAEFVRDAVREKLERIGAKHESETVMS